MRDIRERVLDILESIERIEKYGRNGRGEFETNELVQVWILHHLQILGEAVYDLRWSRTTRKLREGGLGVIVRHRKDFPSLCHALPSRRPIAKTSR